ncbi:MAG TPA: ABC transporter permease [Phycisphaerae bacterium]|nr:ABC transporter permease [Phycisphaerae bacterium]
MLRLSRAKEWGLVVDVLAIGALLAFFGGTVSQKTRDPATGRVTGQVEVNKFLQRPNLDNVIKHSSWTAVMAVGATVLIIAGGIDLSIGAIYCLAAVTGGMMLRWLGPAEAHASCSPAWVVPLGIIATILVGTACGAVNGLMVTLLRVHPFIITLGTMSIFRGIAFVTTQAQAVTDYPPVFGEIMRYTAADFTIAPILIVLGVALAGHVFLQMTVAGRQAYAVGGNETASLYSGIPIQKVKVLVFAIAGLTGGVAAVISLGTFGSADSSTGQGYELDVIAAAVVGGASLSGGHGSALGAILGAVVIALIGNGIVILAIDQNYTEMIKGGVIIVAVLLDRFSARLGERRMMATRR